MWRSTRCFVLMWLLLSLHRADAYSFVCTHEKMYALFIIIKCNLYTFYNIAQHSRAQHAVIMILFNLEFFFHSSHDKNFYRKMNIFFVCLKNEKRAWVCSKIDIQYLEVFVLFLENCFFFISILWMISCEYFQEKNKIFS